MSPLTTKVSMKLYLSHKSKILITLLMGIVVWGCSDSQSEERILVTGVYLSEKAKVIKVGEQFKLWASVLPENATDKTLVWKVEDSGIANVSEDGTVTTLKCGCTSIAVTSGEGEHSERCIVTVVEPSLPSAKDYSLAWYDEFDYEGKPDPTRWKTRVWNSGTVNHELQSYSDDNNVLQVSDGILKITAMMKNNAVVSGRIETVEPFKEGYYEAKIRIPKGKGVWPAFWLIGAPEYVAEWPLCGEVDILEAVGHMPTEIYSNIWSQEYSHNETMVEYYLPTSRDEFHIYAAEISDDAVSIYVDNILVNELKNEHKGVACYPYNDKYSFNIVLNLAFGGEFGGQQGVDYNCLPATLEVDYVRVFKK